MADRGSCPQRKEIQSALDYWKQTDEAVRSAEHHALKSMGLGQYRDFDDLRRAMAAGPSQETLEKWAQQRKHAARLQRANVAKLEYCSMIASNWKGRIWTLTDRGAYDACLKKYDLDTMLFQQEAATNYCSANTASEEMRLECKIENDPVLNLEEQVRWKDGNRAKSIEKAKEVIVRYCRRSAAVQAQFDACRANYDAEALLAGRLAAETECAKLSSAHADKRYYVKYTDCLYQKDTLRKMVASGCEAERARLMCEKRTADPLSRCTIFVAMHNGMPICQSHETTPRAL